MQIDIVIGDNGRTDHVQVLPRLDIDAIRTQYRANGFILAEGVLVNSDLLIGEFGGRCAVLWLTKL